ncbi:MAG TPA: hypothetical protein VN682_06600 [Terriglobales bacterium]|nr:hypothetical protein [Terriglobales bacterium]
MSSRKPLSGRRVSRFAFAVLLALACSRAAHANAWSPGQVITYGEFDWATGGSASSLLADHYLAVYPTATVLTGQPIGGFVDIFDNPATISAYLPTVGSGSDASLDSDYIDPASDSSGSLGGSVLALELGVDFSDAGVTLGSSDIPFGDLVLENVALVPSADGLTVRQFLADANTDLGGGTSPFTVVQADELALGLAEAFDGGIPSSSPKKV